ncbi:MAG: hypothetical protein V4747_07565 [Pseudomonadota bacterium]
MGILDQYLAGREARRQQDAADQANAMQGFLQQNGQAIFAGDQNALGQLAGMGAEGLNTAFNVQGNIDTRNRNARTDARADVTADREAWRFEKETTEYAKSISAEQAQAEAAAMEKAVKAALMTETPEQFDALMAQMEMPQFQGMWDQREALASQFMPMVDVLKTRAGAEPLSPEGKFAADVRNGLVDPSAATPRDTAAEQRIARLIEGGIDRETAIGIVDGRLVVSRDPLEGTVTIVDVAKAPRVGAPTPANNPPAPPPSPEGLTFGSAYENAPAAFGIEGAARKLANNVTDVIGVSPAFPDTMQAQSDFAVLKENLINDIASGYGRQPPSWLLKNIEALTPEAGQVFTGPEDAQAKLRSIGNSLQGERQLVERQLAGRISPTQRMEYEAKLAGLDAGLDRVRAALGAFATGSAPKEDIDLMNQLLGE